MLRPSTLFQQYFVDGIDAKRLWRRYVVGLSLIVTLLLGSHAASIWAIHASESDAEIIDDSGRQRMLSQRILYFAANAEKIDRAAQRAMISAIDLFEQSHEALISSPTLSEDMRRLYFSSVAGPSLDRMVRNYIADARWIASAGLPTGELQRTIARMERTGPTLLLDQLNRAVQMYEREAQERSAQISTLQHYSLLLAIFTIAVEAFLIFLPAQLAARGALEKLEDKTKALQWARHSEAAKNKALEEMRRAAEHEALHDPLTGLANRRYLEREMARYAEEAEQRDEGVAVLHVDLDRFKEINDTLGHAAGDFVLSRVAAVLKELSGKNDFVARVGGDEFVVLTRFKGDRRPLEALASRVIDKLRRPVEYEGGLCRFGASIGIDIGIAEASCANIDATRLLANADIALYRAKELGRGRFAFFCDALRAELELSRSLCDEIALAFAQGEFFPVYQPQICVETGALHGVEALARWRHPTRGVLTPAMFLPVAERLGVTAEIDAQIFEAALRDLQNWDDIGLDVPRLSVNVSSRRLRDPRLAQQLSRLSIPRDRVSFEILETVFADVIGDEMRAALDLISELGVTIEVDDFGTGHASLSSIIALTPRRLKIARELIAPIPTSHTHLALTRAVIEIGRALDIELIAEGVETEAQEEALAALNCSVLQGYRFAKPMTAEAFSALASSTSDWRPRGCTAISA